MSEKVFKSEAEWKAALTPEQFHVLRDKGTEWAFTGKYYVHHEKGTYLCAGCGNELFSSETKYESGSGWPSFWAPLRADALEATDDTTHLMVRTEVMCARCGGHLGHLFDDGPEPTGHRYCINSGALQFRETEEKK